MSYLFDSLDMNCSLCMFCVFDSHDMIGSFCMLYVFDSVDMTGREYVLVYVFDSLEIMSKVSTFPVWAVSIPAGDFGVL